MISFFIPGVPVAKGSARAFVARNSGKLIVRQSNADRIKPWASLITMMAQEQGMKPDSSAYDVGLEFIMPRPKSHFNSKGELKLKAPYWHTKKPDLDKLIRCVLDAFSGVVYQDDNQVCHLIARKHYTMGQQPGCMIVIERK